MKISGIYSRILLTLSLIGVIFLLLLISLYFIANKQEDLIIKESKEQFQVEINSLIILKTALLKQIVYDYTFWDDFVNNLKKPDTAWYSNNITTIIKSFHIDYVCVYDTNNNIVHEASSEEFSSPIIISSEILDILKKSKFFNFFQVTANGLVEISCASVHPNNDPMHNLTKPSGYLFLAKSWNTGSIKELSILSGTKTKLLTGNDTIDENYPYSISSVQKLNGWEGNEVARIIFTRTLNSLKLYHRMSIAMMLVLLGTFFTAGIVFHFSISAWIDKPLKLVASILKSGNLKQIIALRQCRGEFKDIGILFNEFIKQKDDLRNAKEHAEESERRFKNILDNSPFHIWEFEVDRFSYVNKAYLDFAGISDSEGREVEMNLRKNVHPDDLEHANQNWREIWEKRQETDIYFRILNKQGVYRNFWSHAVPIFDKNGNFSHFQGYNIDITEAKEAERKILELNEDLDLRVKQRTTELEVAIRELETFSYSVSHDLKAPLRHINGFIGIILENKSTGLSEEELGYLQKISGSANEMNNLIDALLSFSRLNQAELRKTIIQSSELVHQVIKFFEPELQNRKIIFNVEPLADALGDQELIRQVWTNLISNAIKYTGKKPEAIIDIGSFSTDHETTFFVKDNGVGFQMKYAEKLFGVFQRLHKTRDYEGIGIGLANIKRIISRHGGECRAEGEPDMGATFYFSLPK